MNLEKFIAETIAKIIEQKVEGILGTSEQSQEQREKIEDKIEIESVDRSDLESNAKSA